MVKADSICGCTLSLSGPPSGNDGGHGTSGQGLEGGYGGASAEAPDVTTEELRELFGGIGQVSIPSALSLLLVIDGKGKTRRQIFFNFIP
nr:hypothetical protein CFP56_29740 [Quercus suber]